MRAFIVEDELMAQNKLVKALENDFDDIKVVGTATSVKDAVKWLQSNEADVIFMDVELSDGRCFDIFRQVDVKSRVVMTTAYDNYAVKAFEVNSIDYLLKPINPADLKRAVDRCRESTNASDVRKLLDSLGAGKSTPTYKERYLVRLNDRIVPVKTSEISYFFSEAKNNYAVTLDGTVYVIDSTLDSLSAELDPSIFFRISRSCIVAKDSVESLTKLLGGRLAVKTPTKLSSNSVHPDLTVSRSRADDFLAWLES